jgi:hypothetical protein
LPEQIRESRIVPIESIMLPVCRSAPKRAPHPNLKEIFCLNQRWVARFLSARVGGV